VQFVPGGRSKQIIAGSKAAATVLPGIAGGRGRCGIDHDQRPRAVSGAHAAWAARFIADLERRFGFDKPPLEQFLNMMWKTCASIFLGKKLISVDQAWSSGA